MRLTTRIGEHKNDINKKPKYHNVIKKHIIATKKLLPYFNWDNIKKPRNVIHETKMVSIYKKIQKYVTISILYSTISMSIHF